MCVFMPAHTCLCLYKFVSIYMCVSIYSCMCLSIVISLCMCVCVSFSVCVCSYICSCVFICMWESLIMYVFFFTYFQCGCCRVIGMFVHLLVLTREYREPKPADRGAAVAMSHCTRRATHCPVCVVHTAPSHLCTVWLIKKVLIWTSD